MRVPAQTAAKYRRAVGALTAVVEDHVSPTGSYRPPVLRPTGAFAPHTIICEPDQTAA
jgi:hypothetical protein